MEEIKLLGTFRSPFSYRVIWALKLKGVKYQFIEEDLSNKSTLLLQYNPVYKRIPVLVHGGKPIAESIVILEYIEDTWPENPLLPKDACERAAVRFWIKFGEDKGPTFYAFFRTVGDEQQEAIINTLEVLKTLEEHGLGDKKFFGGNVIGLADIALGWMAYWLPIMEEVIGVKMLEAQAFPRLLAWMENFKEAPVIKENLPDHDALFAHFKRLRQMFVTSAIS